MSLRGRHCLRGAATSRFTLTLVSSGSFTPVPKAERLTKVCRAQPGLSKKQSEGKSQRRAKRRSLSRRTASGLPVPPTRSGRVPAGLLPASRGPCHRPVSLLAGELPGWRAALSRSLSGPGPTPAPVLLRWAHRSVPCLCFLTETGRKEAPPAAALGSQWPRPDSAMQVTSTFTPLSLPQPAGGPAQSSGVTSGCQAGLVTSAHHGPPRGYIISTLAQGTLGHARCFYPRRGHLQLSLCRIH